MSSRSPSPRVNKDVLSLLIQKSFREYASRQGLISMESRKILAYLEDLAFRLGVEIVYEKLGEEEFPARGGLCKVKGAYKIFVDRSETIEGQIKILACALSSFNTEDVYILPFIRGILNKAQGSSE